MPAEPGAQAAGEFGGVRAVDAGLGPPAGGPGYDTFLVLRLRKSMRMNWPRLMVVVK